VSHELAHLFDLVDELSELTESRFDPTVCVLNLACVKLLAEQGRPLLPEYVWHLCFAIGWKTKIKRKLPTLALRHNRNTNVDTDRVAKAFVFDNLFDAPCDALAATGQAAGPPPSLCFDWAGDIRAVGSHPSGTTMANSGHGTAATPTSQVLGARDTCNLPC
jgi:thiamine biosynthesis lipoprotein ApbE